MSQKNTLSSPMVEDRFAFSWRRSFTVSLAASALVTSSSLVFAQKAPEDREEFARYAQKLRETALTKLERMEPRVQVPTTAQRNTYSPYARRDTGRYPWKTNIVTTVFWVGEKATARNPVANHASSWDANWVKNYGGYDDPDPNKRRGYIPAAFVPKLNPFYVALPYNDVTKGTTKPEARFVIPWFHRAFERPGKSVCKDRWVAIRKGNRICYAQWSDCGPFSTDHWQYVFGNERPRPNINGGAGLDVSPAVRDYLGLNHGKDVCDWKFVEFHEVPHGPWSRYGSNNHFVTGINPDRHVRATGSTGTTSGPRRPVTLTK